MAYNYLRYAIACPHLYLFNHEIKGTLAFKQQRWCLCQRQVVPERPSPRYNNGRRRLSMYQFCILYFIIITLIEIIIIAMFFSSMYKFAI